MVKKRRRLKIKKRIQKFWVKWNEEFKGLLVYSLIKSMGDLIKVTLGGKK